MDRRSKDCRILSAAERRRIHGRRGLGLGDGCGRELPAPTTTLPGTSAKLAVLEDRAAAGLALFSPADRAPDER
ncbi:MAG TPA: hypothetical protein VFE62_20570 [Gemmataceae bacterium]|nr:hypothetical protein [Gemmataceae bacterium]